jgi:hypothetical protein
MRKLNQKFAFLLVCSMSLLLFNNSTSAQPTIMWQNTIGSTANDILNGVVQTNDGGYILAGFNSGGGISGDKTVIGSCWLVKVNSVGVIEWQKGYVGGSGIYALQQTLDGGYILGCGSALGIVGDKTEPNTGGTGAEDFWIIKTDNLGNIQWQNTIGGNGTDILKEVLVNVDNSYFVAGYSNSEASGDKLENNIGGGADYDYWLMQLDVSGNIVWENTIGGNSGDLLYAAQKTLDGGYLVGGLNGGLGGGDMAETPVTGSGYWAVKINSAGVIEWENLYEGGGGGSNSGIRSIAVASDGGYLIGGYSSQPGLNDKTESSISNDYWVIKINNIGTIEWDNTITGGSIGADILTSTFATADDGFILGGHSNSTAGGDKSEASPAGVNDYWVVKINEFGSIQWDYTINTSGQEELNNITQVADGGYIIGGKSNSGIGFEKTESNVGDYDFWVIKLNPETCNATASITPGGALTFCKGSSVLLTANTGIGLTYQWKKNGANIAGATGLTYIANKSGSYTVLVNNGFCTSLSATIVVTVNNTPTATITNVDATNNLCIDASIKLKANGGVGFIYQWYKGASALIGETGQFHFATTTGNYKVKVTNASGCSKTSSPYTIVNVCKLETENPEAIYLYPNPTCDKIKIDLPEAGNYNIQITDISGKVVFSSALNNQTNISIDVSSLPANVYVVSIQNEYFDFKTKVVKID